LVHKGKMCLQPPVSTEDVVEWTEFLRSKNKIQWCLMWGNDGPLVMKCWPGALSHPQKDIFHGKKRVLQ
jgi:hypothetical protein